ncbi:class I SAM-dependent RNA methyltransferase [Pseudonocardia spinosispora]|uniref:class I SAM-dependent RNA methyltransferase n=1 Tax=Pseudonocardia spinosispora TaxID=103441 RepID=UPI0003FFE9E8|nr:TRAM domain-containing protein [Pseudonocardia spinosispora]
MNAAKDTVEQTVAESWLDRVLELDVGPVAHGGHCVARVDGRVVFVRHALPGERVRVVVTEDRHGSFCRADTVTVLLASPDRVEAPCVWARPGGCGGCDFQHATPDAQRALKGEVLAEQLQRLAGVRRSVEVEELPGGPLGWRQRVRLAVGPDGWAGFRAHREHDVIPIADCSLAPTGMLAPVLSRQWRPGDEVQVELDSDGEVHVSSGSERDPAPVSHRAAGREWTVAPGAFWQVHPALADTLSDVVRQWADVPSGGRAWDLYGGAGVLAAVLAEQTGGTGVVTVVESDRAAVRSGMAALADLPWVRWRTGRVEHALDELTQEGRPDVVVADPPRKGLGRAVVDQLADAGPDRLVHVACDPAALARDVSLLAGHGYRLERLRAFDAFPMTHHMEAVALFVR